MRVRIVNKSSHGLPAYETPTSAVMDLRADLESSVIIKPLERALIPTGLFIELPDGYEAQVRPRSGLAIKKGISVLNTPGTIDSDYRGEIKVILINLSKEDFTVNSVDRIAQMIISKFEKVQWEETSEIMDTERGHGGFGSTGH